MKKPNISLQMVIDVKPYEHQKRAIKFALEVFGVLPKDDDADERYNSESRNDRRNNYTKRERR